jgi:hypothetical protein
MGTSTRTTKPGRLLTSLETVHTDMITRITQFKAQTSHCQGPQPGNGGAAD